MESDRVTVRPCDGAAFEVRADFGHRRTKYIEGHPYCLEQLKLILHTQCSLTPGARICIDRMWWTVESIIDQVGSLLAVQLVHTSPAGCPTLDIVSSRIIESADGSMPTEEYVGHHFGMFWPVEGGITDDHDTHAWRQIARIYILDGMPSLTSLTHLRVNGELWKPLSSHDDGNYHRIPYIRAIHDPWPLAIR